jgi:hypothetical protein
VLLITIVMKLVKSDKRLLDIGVMYTEESDIYLSHTHWLIIADVGVTPFRIQVKGLYEEIQALGDVHEKLKVLANGTELIEIKLHEEVINRRSQRLFRFNAKMGNN